MFSDVQKLIKKVKIAEYLISHLLNKFLQLKLDVQLLKIVKLED